MYYLRTYTATQFILFGYNKKKKKMSCRLIPRLIPTQFQTNIYLDKNIFECYNANKCYIILKYLQLNIQDINYDIHHY